MKPTSTRILPPTDVMCVASEAGLSAVGQAWAELEDSLPSLGGRKFYGTFQAPDGPYRACVGITPSDVPEALRLERWTIPGGLYASRKVRDWEEDPEKIPSGFALLAQEFTPDPSRPGIEFYRSRREVILFLPVKDRAATQDTPH